MKHISEIIPEAIGHIRPFTHGSLFSGIGGFDLAAEWMGWENKFHCEWNTFGQKVLNYYWPKAETFTDITKSNFTKFNGTIDIISGGFPCQPYSQAGKRKGKEDERHLWPEMLRAIREIQPGYVVGENVRGLTNWNGGLVFDEVQADLEFEGYEVLPFLLPACAVNAPHRRDRIWFIAYSKRNGRKDFCRNMEEKTGAKRGERSVKFDGVTDTCENGYVTNTESNGEHRAQELKNGSRQSGERGGCDTDNPSEVPGQDGRTNAANTAEQRSERGERRTPEGQRLAKHSELTANTNSRRQPGKEHRKEEPGRIAEKSLPNDWSDFPTQSPLCSRNDGLSAQLSGITFSKHRNESIKAYGNAVVPQIPFEIFKAIEAYEKQNKNDPIRHNHTTGNKQRNY